MLEVGVLLLGLSACVLCLVCQFLGFGGFALQDVQAVAQRGDFAFIAGTLHLGAARHEVVPQGDKGEGIVLRCDGLAVHQPVDFTFQPYAELPAHVGLDVERGGDVELLEAFVPVARPHAARNGDGAVVADALTVDERQGLAALRHGVAEIDAVLVALCEGAAHARACPDVEPLRAAVRPQFHEVEAHAELGVVEVHQVVAVCLDGHRLRVELRKALFTAVARPEVLRPHAHPRTDGVVHAAANGRCYFVALLGIKVLIPDICSPRQSALGIDAPGACAQFAVAVSWHRCHETVISLRLRLRADGDDCGEQCREICSCPSAAERWNERFRSSFVHTQFELKG